MIAAAGYGMAVAAAVLTAAVVASVAIATVAKAAASAAMPSPAVTAVPSRTVHGTTPVRTIPSPAIPRVIPAPAIPRVVPAPAIPGIVPAPAIPGVVPIRVVPIKVVRTGNDNNARRVEAHDTRRAAAFGIIVVRIVVGHDGVFNRLAVATAVVGVNICVAATPCIPVVRVEGSILIDVFVFAFVISGRLCFGLLCLFARYEINVVLSEATCCAKAGKKGE